MTFPHLIGLVGQMGSGKTSVARGLVESGLVSTIKGFADPIKVIGQDYFQINPTVKTKKSRKAWQTIGQTFRDIYEEVYGSPDVWSDYLFRQYDNSGRSCAIHDVRHTNEMSGILERGGVIVYLKVSGPVRKERIELRDGIEFVGDEWSATNNHFSEVYSTWKNFSKLGLVEKCPDQVFVIEQGTSSFEMVFSQIVQQLTT